MTDKKVATCWAVAGLVDAVDAEADKNGVPRTVVAKAVDTYARDNANAGVDLRGLTERSLLKRLS